jgi:hypothetical protein
VDCRDSPFGARVTVEAFKNVALQNGWKVVSSSIFNYGSAGTVGWDAQPLAGAAAPYGKYHAAVNNGGQSLGALMLIVEGPAGTKPGEDMFVISPWPPLRGG